MNFSDLEIAKLAAASYLLENVWGQHYYKKGFSRGLKTHAKRFSRGYKTRLRNWWCNIYSARGTFRDGYPSQKVAFRDGYPYNSRGKSLFASDIRREKYFPRGISVAKSPPRRKHTAPPVTETGFIPSRKPFRMSF